MRCFTKTFLILLLIAPQTLVNAASQSTDLGQNRNPSTCVKSATVSQIKEEWGDPVPVNTYFNATGHQPSECPVGKVPIAVYRSNLSQSANTYNWTTDSIKRSDTDYVFFYYPAGRLGYANQYANYLLYCAPIVYNWVCTP